MKPMYLQLEDGTVFEGQAITAARGCAGLLSFYTGVVGYQEVITDPANLGKIILFTYPLIGNYGVNAADAESSSPKVAGILAKEYPPYYSNFRAEGNLKDYLEPSGVVFAHCFDTRAILLHMREHGEMRAVISADRLSAEKVGERLAASAGEACFAPTSTENSPIPCADAKLRAHVIDLGASRSFYRSLAALKIDATFTPNDADAVLVSDAPYGAVTTEANIARVREWIGKKPVLGFGHGSAIAALACGGGVTRMPFGDHGMNIPVRSPAGGRNEITVQNHNYTVNTGGAFEALFTNIHDGTCEGFVHRETRTAGANFTPNQTWFDAMLAAAGFPPAGAGFPNPAPTGSVGVN